jgi:hypothetical protein
MAHPTNLRNSTLNSLIPKPLKGSLLIGKKDAVQQNQRRTVTKFCGSRLI